MFGHESKPSRIWSFGAGEPVESLEIVRQQILLSHRYRNVLCRLELDRRAAAEAVVRELRPTLARLEAEAARRAAELEAIRQRIRDANQQAGRRRQTPEEREATRGLRERSRATWQAFREARREAYAAEDVLAALAAVEATHHNRALVARAESGLYWGNYLAVETAAKSFRKGSPPRFQPWQGGEGRVVVQIQGGLSVEALLAGTDPRLQLHLRHTKGRGKKPKQAGEVWFRVGTVAGGRAPLWAKAPVVVHRPLPADARVKWAYLACRREHGTHWRWDLQLVLARDAWEIPDAPPGGVVGIDLGWRMLPDGSLRVAAWVGSDGDRGQLALGPQDLGRWSQSESLRGTGDRAFDDARGRLSDWLAGREGLPDWLAEVRPHLRQWRSRRRLARLVLRWRGERFAGDEEIFPWLDGHLAEGHYVGWRAQDRHLLDWERAAHEKAIAWRDHLYRNFVARLRRKYRTAHIEDTDWRDLAELPAPEGDAPPPRLVRGNRFIAAPGRLAEIIREGFASHEEVPAAYTTQRCHRCGRMDAFDAAAELVRECRHCGCREDQDWRAAQNLLNWPREGEGDGPNPGGLSRS